MSESKSCVQGTPFSHPCLRQCLITFFFGNDGGLARRKTQLFGPKIPLATIALVATAVCLDPPSHARQD
jgi:hypothetical protein